MSQLAKTLKPKSGPDGTFFRARYQVGITFGGTELKAFVEWKENVCALGIAPLWHVLMYLAITNYMTTHRALRSAGPQLLYRMRWSDLTLPRCCGTVTVNWMINLYVTKVFRPSKAQMSDAYIYRFQGQFACSTCLDAGHRSTKCSEYDMNYLCNVQNPLADPTPSTSLQQDTNGLRRAYRLDGS
jgi:hypothetical protein